MIALRRYLTLMALLLVVGLAGACSKDGSNPTSNEDASLNPGCTDDDDDAGGDDADEPGDDDGPGDDEECEDDDD